PSSRSARSPARRRSPSGRPRQHRPCSRAPPEPGSFGDGPGPVRYPRDVTRHAAISGVGSSLPGGPVPNTYFESLVEPPDEWIRDRTGIVSRHSAETGVATSDLALDAAMKALKGAGLHAGQLDLIVVASLTPDTPIPSTA